MFLLALISACSPSVNSINPKKGPATGGTEVTFKGIRFYEGAKITFGKSECTDVKLSSDKEMTCKTPVGTAGSVVDIKIKNADNFESTLTKAFTYESASSSSSTTATAITATSSKTALTVSGTATITAAGGNGSYSYGASTGTITAATATTATYTAPASIAGSSTTVTITVADTSSSSTSLTMTIYPTLTFNNSSSSTLTIGGPSIVLTATGGIPGYTYTAAPKGTLTAAASSSATSTYTPPSTSSGATFTNSAVTLTVSDTNSGSATTVVNLVAPSTVHAGGNQSCILLSDNLAKCFGSNSSGQLGNDDIAVTAVGDGASEMGLALSRIDLGTSKTASKFAVGGSHACATLNDGTIKCWGENGNGQLGQADTVDRGGTAGDMAALTAIPLPVGRTGKIGTANQTLSAGTSHVCAILDNDQFLCWGKNTSGQLGDTTMGMMADKGDDEAISTLTEAQLGAQSVTMISAGGDHTCAINGVDGAYCWGENSSGEVGVTAGSTADQATPVLVDLGTGKTATLLAAGGQHTCAKRSGDNAVVCWGDNTYGQLGIEDNTATLDKVGDGAAEMGDNLTVTNLGTGRTASALCAGTHFNCAILDNATVKCWGRNQSGQLGQGNTTNLGDNANEMGDNLAVIDLGTGRTAKSISCGAEHVCVRLDNWTTKCWGRNTEGQLGQGDTTNRGDTANMGDTLPILSL